MNPFQRDPDAPNPFRTRPSGPKPGKVVQWPRGRFVEEDGGGYTFSVDGRVVEYDVTDIADAIRRARLTPSECVIGDETRMRLVRSE